MERWPVVTTISRRHDSRSGIVSAGGWARPLEKWLVLCNILQATGDGMHVLPETEQSLNLPSRIRFRLVKYKYLAAQLYCRLLFIVARIHSRTGGCGGFGRLGRLVVVWARG